ncbi:spherulation-specific family 4 protein, partial [Streptomyces sp. NPDC005925]|uniref:spherulation-specific family 4 protein n=1 Tax=Streptomyces sp. NPDC005925 TaxID=3157172 RepID=UPI0033EBE6A5
AEDAHVRVLGRLDAVHGARSFGDLVAEGHRYLDRYQVDGVLLDRCPTEDDAPCEVRRTVTTLRAIRGDAHIVLGHGTHPHPGYAENADQMVTFCGPWSDYRWSQAPERTADHPPERFCHVMHGLPGQHLNAAPCIARRQGAGTIFLTGRARCPDGRPDECADAEPFATVPGYWDDIVSRIGTGVSE